MTDTTASPIVVRYVNGVFKGGGAKGIAYAGALTAMRERGLWFRSVAGASAGAITASLIAAGLGPDELADAVPEGLKAMKSSVPERLGKAIIGHATSVFESKGLRAWLNGTLARCIGADDDTPVTFEALYAAKGIELYVVAMDLSSGLPIVFSRRTTPKVEVAGAVAASSAIPGAFPPGRGVFHAPDDGAVVHQFVDGGTWANYPSFIFQDRSFRAWLRGSSQANGQWSAEELEEWNTEAARPVVGFILGEPRPLEHRKAIGMVPLAGPDVNHRFDQGPTYTSPKPVPYLIGAVLSSDWARLLLGAAMAVWVALTITTMPIGVRRFSTWLADLLPDAFYPLVLVGTMSLVVLAAAVAIGLIGGLVLVGRLIADTLMPSVQALIGVPTNVAPWIGLGEDSVVLRVPHQGLATTEFNVGEAARAAAISDAHRSVLAQLENPTTVSKLEALFTGDPETVECPDLGAPKAPITAGDPDQLEWSGVIAAIGATMVIGGVGWWGTNSAGSDGIGIIALSVVIGLLVGGAALVFVGARAGRRSAARARFGVTAKGDDGGAAALIAIALGVFAIVAGAWLSAHTMDSRDQDTLRAKVVSSSVVPGSNENAYEVQADGAAPIALLSSRHLRLSEEVFVHLDRTTGETKLVGALDDGRFPIAVVLWLLGLGALTSGIRQRRWLTRCRRLQALAVAEQGG
ncbi:MAG: patatin-like phospholipase family protein [Ilumatobacteraceae bacterium]